MLHLGKLSESSTLCVDELCGIGDLLLNSLSLCCQNIVECSGLRDALQARAKIAPQVRHVSLAEIESLQLPAQARKRRTFVDLR